MAKIKPKQEEPIVRDALDLKKVEEKPQTLAKQYPTVTEINAEMDEYGWCKNNLVEIARMILRELVIARLERRKNG